MSIQLSLGIAGLLLIAGAGVVLRSGVFRQDQVPEIDLLPYDESMFAAVTQPAGRRALVAARSGSRPRSAAEAAPSSVLACGRPPRHASVDGREGTEG